MGDRGTTAIRIGLHDVAGLRWPRPVLAGDGERETAAVPLPRLPWSKAAIEVPMGRSAAQAVARATRLRKIFGYGVAPTVIVLFVPDAVSWAAGAPYVARDQLRFLKAPREAVAQLVQRTRRRLSDG